MGLRSSSRSPFLEAVVSGGGAYLVGYLLTYLWTGGYSSAVATEAVVRFRATGYDSYVGETTLSNLLGDGGVAATTWTGWLFSNAQFVPITAGTYPVSRTAVPNLLLAADDIVLSLLFFVPPIVLLVAGAYRARNAALGTVTVSASLGLRLPTGAVRGTGIVAGYLPLVVVSAVAFTAATTDARAAALSPDLLSSTLVAGLLYPIVFGGLGGWIAAKRTATTREATITQ